MPWKDIKKLTYEEEKQISKRAIKVPTHPLFSNSHTRLARELNQSENCKITVDKKLTISQSKAYNQILEDEREKNEPRRARDYRKRKKESNAVTCG